ncbi:hypothetical protein BSKO_01029 [Bryopsis sp. KO-2023]|nr:hypothetical protein BSKO_01029 [Bryopsis sp. KO-2023]
MGWTAGAKCAYDDLSIAWECRSTRLICVAEDAEHMKRHRSEWLVGLAAFDHHPNSFYEWFHEPVVGTYFLCAVLYDNIGCVSVLLAFRCPTSFTIRKALYKGKASLLYVATDLITSKDVVLKLYRKSKLSTLNRYQVEREIRIHSRLKHDFIVALYAAFEDAKYVYMVQEYAEGGDLFGYLKKAGGQFKERRAVHDVIQPFLNVLRYLHSLGIIHRDIKPENILVTGDTKIRVADFGLSIDIKKERPVTRAGTLDYMAPEVLVCPDKKHPDENKDNLSLAYSKQVDIWAVGVLAYEMIVGYPPFEKESRGATYDEIMHGDPSFPSWMTEGCQDFIKQALTKNSAERPDIIGLMKHPWIAVHKRRNSYHASKLEVSMMLKSKSSKQEEGKSRDSDNETDRPEKKTPAPKTAKETATSPGDVQQKKEPSLTEIAISPCSYDFKDGVSASQQAEPEPGKADCSGNIDLDQNRGTKKSASKKCQEYVTPPTGILSETTVVLPGVDQTGTSPPSVSTPLGSSKSSLKGGPEAKQGKVSAVAEKSSSSSDQCNESMGRVDKPASHATAGSPDAVSLPPSTTTSSAWRQASSPLNPSRSKDTFPDASPLSEVPTRPKEKGLGSQVMEALGFTRPASPGGDSPAVSRVASLRPIKLFSSLRDRANRSNAAESKEVCEMDSEWEVASRESSITPFPPASPAANLRPAHRLDREISGSQLSFVGKQCGTLLGSPRIAAEYGNMHKSSSLSNMSIDCSKASLAPMAAEAYDSCGGLKDTSMQ